MYIYTGLYIAFLSTSHVLHGTCPNCKNATSISGFSTSQLCSKDKQKSKFLNLSKNTQNQSLFTIFWSISHLHATPCVFRRKASHFFQIFSTSSQPTKTIEVSDYLDFNNWSPQNIIRFETL